MQVLNDPTWFFEALFHVLTIGLLADVVVLNLFLGKPFPASVPGVRQAAWSRGSTRLRDHAGDRVISLHGSPGLALSVAACLERTFPRKTCWALLGGD